MNDASIQRMLARMVAAAARGDLEAACEAQWRCTIAVCGMEDGGEAQLRLIQSTLEAVRAAPASSEVSSLLGPLDGELPDVAPDRRGEVGGWLWAAVMSVSDGVATLWLVEALIDLIGVEGLLEYCGRDADQLPEEARSVIRRELGGVVVSGEVWKRVQAVVARL